ncbi:MAG: hypothetical protein WC683_13560 [bacterium]
MIPADSLEEKVWRKVCDGLAKREVMVPMVDNATASEVTTLDSERALAEGRLKASRAEEGRFIRLYGQGVLDDVRLAAEMARCRREIGEAQAELDRLKALAESQATGARWREVVMERLEKLGELLPGADTMTRRVVLEALDITVTVSGRNLEPEVSGRVVVDREQTSRPCRWTAEQRGSSLHQPPQVNAQHPPANHAEPGHEQHEQGMAAHPASKNVSPVVPAGISPRAPG